MKFHPLRFGQGSIVKGQLLKEKVFSALVYILLFIFLLYPYRDYDWGWHYRMGEYFFQHGKMLVANKYTWTMPGYQWVNHEWLYDPLEYLVFSAFSFVGMSIAGASVALSWFYLGVRKYKLSYWQKGILALFFANLISGVVWQGLRSQMLGTLFLSIFMYFVPNILKGDRKTLIFLPFLFLLWANFHGYFLIGLCLFGLVLLGQFITIFVESRLAHAKRFFVPKSLLFGGVCLFACFLATFINPFTYQIYLEGLRHLYNPLLPYILEWVPFQLVSSFSIIFFLYTIFIIAVFGIRRKIKDIPYILVFIFMLYYSLSARRYVSPYVAVTIPMVAFLLKSIPLHLEKYKATTFLFLLACVIGLQIGIFKRIPNFHLLNYTFNDYCFFGSGCSEKLVGYLKEHPPKGYGLNFYDWGGYLIGRGVPAKLFIDGRMHLWKNEKTGFLPFMSYQAMYYDGDYALFNKENFDWLIVHTDSPIYQKIKNTKDVGLWNLKFQDGSNVYLERVRQ